MMLFLRSLFLLTVSSTPVIAQINQSEASGLVTPCNFTVTDLQGSSCDLVQFSQKCPGPSGFEINGGHSDLEFIVLVLYNTRSAAKAYFGASDDALNYHADIPVQVKSAYPASSMDKRWGRIQSRDEEDLVTNTRLWMVQNVTRGKVGRMNTAINQANIASYEVIEPGLNRVSLDFMIQDTANSSTEPCNIVLGANNTNLETLEWSYQKSTGSGYSVSWGYTPVADAGVMTVISAERDTVSFFGFDDISKRDNLGSAGPNPAISL
ncbi:hypothetical protein SUNI508_09816 [Seiridium unicorne]|uniref:Uncharacterized protein n=1 Tax=Seiridium unicorne TaxID=138068 RepID=A0ABR2UN33_9PEZI